MEILLLLIIGLLVLIAAFGIKIVPQSQEYVVEQFGKYIKTLGAGLNFIVPLLNNVTHKVSILERQLEPQHISVITKDNVEIQLDTIVFFRIVDAAKSVYRIEGIDQALITTVTGIVRATSGQLVFDEVQSKRDYISEEIQKALSKASSVWGIEITRTEILDVGVDESTKKAMQLQLNSERERRAVVTKAEGEREAQQLKADAELYTAEKQAEARRVLADAEAYSTKAVGEAIKENGQPAIDFEIMKRQIESFSNIAESQNSKLMVLPTDITKTLGTVTALIEGLKKE